MKINESSKRTAVDAENMQEMLDEFINQQSVREKEAKLDSFRHLNQFVRPGQIVFAGSSLMEQFPIYELMLDLKLPYTIYNRGIGGYTTSEMLRTMKECIYDLHPSFVFINIGTNDMNGPDYDQRLLMGRYEEILRGIQQNLPDAQVYLLSYYPVNPVVASQNPHISHILQYRTNARIQAANEGVRELARRLGMHYLDLCDGLYDEEGKLQARYTVEGMHMYADGYRIVLNNLLPVLEKITRT